MMRYLLLIVLLAVGLAPGKPLQIKPDTGTPQVRDGEAEKSNPGPHPCPPIC